MGDERGHPGEAAAVPQAVPVKTHVCVRCGRLGAGAASYAAPGQSTCRARPCPPPRHLSTPPPNHALQEGGLLVSHNMFADHLPDKQLRRMRKVCSFLFLLILFFLLRKVCSALQTPRPPSCFRKGGGGKSQEAACCWAVHQNTRSLSSTGQQCMRCNERSAEPQRTPSYSPPAAGRHACNNNLQSRGLCGSRGHRGRGGRVLK